MPEIAVVIISVHLDGKSDLLQIAGTENAIGFLLRRIQSREQHSRQNRYDGNYYEEFY